MSGENTSLGIAGGLTKGFIRSPLTPLIMLAALAMGLIALMVVPREEEPQISVPMVNILMQAPGLRADDAVRLVSEPVEMIIQAIDGVEHVYSQTHDDRAMVTARFEVGTSSDAAILRVHEKLRANMDRIPVGIPEPLIIGRGIDDVAIVALTLTAEPGSAISANDLTRLGRELRTDLARVQDVGLSYIVGEAQEAIRIAPDPERLALYGVTLQQLTGKVAAANRTLNAGLVRDAGEQIELVAGQSLTAPAEIAGLLLTTRDNRPVYLGDVAQVEFVPDMSDRIVAHIARAEDGSLTREPAVTLAFSKRAGANAVVVAEALLARAEALQAQLLPEGVAVEITRNYGESAQEKANTLLVKLFLATLSIIALTLMAIGWRESIVVAIVIR
jgi:multidrug efflux pump subunit AcrB